MAVAGGRRGQGLMGTLQPDHLRPSVGRPGAWLPSPFHLRRHPIVIPAPCPSPAYPQPSLTDPLPQTGGPQWTCLWKTHAALLGSF